MRLWTAALGDGKVVIPEDDLPACCRRRAGEMPREGSGAFECASCGAVWETADEG